MENKNVLPKTEEEAWAMPIEDVIEMPAEELFGPEVYRPGTVAEQEALFAVLGKPKGVVFMGNGLQGEAGAGLSDAAAMKGDFIKVNMINERGLRFLEVARLGTRPDYGYYQGQIFEAGEVKTMMHEESFNDETRVWTLTIVWKWLWD